MVNEEAAVKEVAVKKAAVEEGAAVVVGPFPCFQIYKVPVE